MGYSTNFSETLALSRPATDVEKNYINSFNNSRRMKRDVNKLMKLYKGKHGHPTPKSDKPEDIYGNDGEYFVKDDGDFGQSKDNSIIDYNIPPGQPSYDSNVEFNIRRNETQKLIKSGKCQPGLWCQWEISEDGQYLQWDGAEKFYNYVEWLKYLIKHFFGPWVIQLNGEIEWVGENSNDRGKIVVTNNVVKTQRAVITYEEVED